MPTSQQLQVLSELQLRILANRRQVEELVQSLSHEISELESQLKEADTSSRVAASEVLRADDKLLTSLQKLADDLDLGKPRDDEIHRRIQELCTRYFVHMYFSGL